MKKIRLISLLLLFALLLGLFSACDDVPSDYEGGGDRIGEGWEGVDFRGQTVKLCISVNQYNEATFPAADIYTKGPDSANSSEVTKEVFARNAKAERDLNVKIEYTTRDLLWSQISEDIRTLVISSAKDSPDVYNNDISGLSRAMTNGYLWNVKNPGEGIKNYFDFARDGWYTEYIKGCTFDQDKYYIFAGDYFIDMIRMAWVIYVNHDIFSANVKKLPAWCQTLDEFYSFIEDGLWDLDSLADIAESVHADSGMLGVTEKEDTVVGLSTNHVLARIIPSSSGVTLYYLDKENGYKPSVLSDLTDFQRVADKYAYLMGAKGVYLTEQTAAGVKENTLHFVGGNVLFATQRLGEMESTALRNFSAAKGLAPLPKWNQNEQEEYHTVIHNQVELGCVLNTAKAYSAASALMQHLNEGSKDVIHTYYEKGLKYKYNDDKNARKMMDIVRECTDDPFSYTIGNRCEDFYTGTTKLQGLQINKNNLISSTYASEKDAYVDCLRQMVDKFKSFE